MNTSGFRSILSLAGVAAVSLSATAQLRVAVWNISNYGGGRDADLKTSIYGTFEGRSMSPDVIATQEFLSPGAVSTFVTILNTAPGSPGDWAAAPFVDGPDTDSAFFYRTSKVTYLGSTIAAVADPGTTGQPRHTMRYDFRPVGYDATTTAVAIYSVHLKSGSASSDQSRRLIEAQRIRDNAEGIETNGPGSGLPAGYNFIVGGDFNVQSSSQSAYQELVGSQPNNAGRFFDPISTPGSWNNNGTFRMVHTQDPVGAGGMDDRHDQILLSGSLVDGVGMTYKGAFGVPYSTVTWNDPNHSYRCWGNDGTTFDAAMAVATNSMVGPAIAQALKNVCGSAGHLPVFLDLLVPAEIAATATIDFGTVEVGDSASQSLMVWNAGDVARWTADGIAALNYSMAASAGFTAPAGTFSDAAGGATNTHTITMDTSSPGTYSGTLIITSDAPDQPTLIVTLTGEVVDGACGPDVNGDTTVDVLDFLDYLEAFGSCEQQPAPCSSPGGVDADYNGDDSIDVLDFLDFLDAFGVGCD